MDDDDLDIDLGLGVLPFANTPGFASRMRKENARLMHYPRDGVYYAGHASPVRVAAHAEFESLLACSSPTSTSIVRSHAALARG